MLPAFYHKNILGKYKIISNGVDKFWLDNIYTTNKKVSRNKFTVLTVASLEVNKNIISVCKAVSTLNKKGCSVAHYIVGALVDSSILSEIDSMPCSKYLGVKDRQDLMMLYRDVDVFVMVSHKETFGLVYVEAMSQGLPIVYTKGQGFDGQFDEGTAGYHASADSVAEIEDAILRVIDDYARISENVSVLCRKYDWSIIAGTYKHLYTDIIGNNIPERS
jgi:glycosyltransferase involved in cell wall biosynthesis